VSNVTGSNRIEIAAKFDSKLTYVDSTLELPESLGAAFFGTPSYDPMTGEYKATIWLLQQGALLTTGYAKVLTVNFTSNSAQYKDQFVGTLTSVAISEILSPIQAVLVDAILNPSSTTTVVEDHMRYDINGDGKIDMIDLDLIIYNYYLMRKGDPGWDTATLVNGVEIPPAYLFDANADGFIDLTDLIVILSYFTA
jgi:hypothetical protein